MLGKGDEVSNAMWPHMGKQRTEVFLDGSRVSTRHNITNLGKGTPRRQGGCGLPSAVRVLPDLSPDELFPSDPGARILLDPLFLVQQLY